MNITYAKGKGGAQAHATRSALHAEDEGGNPLCGRRSRNVRIWLHGTGEPTCKHCLKLIAAMPAQVERQGQTPSGGRYFIQVTIGGMTVNGQAVPNELAAKALADQMESSFTQPKRLK